MSKQGEREYAIRTDQVHLYTKPFNDPRVFREFAVVLQLLGERIGAGRILDIGCGPGWTTLFLARAGYRGVGVDIAERMIEVARERSAREKFAAEFMVGDMENLDLGRYDFDAVLFFDSLHHCPEYREALRRAHTHLRPGGHVLLMETTLLHRYSRHAREFARTFGVSELGFTRRQLRRALKGAGFTHICFYYDPGACYRGLGGFVKACLRLCCGYFCYYPAVKNIVVARKSESRLGVVARRHAA
jgi:SAM-dependent methyltransferase